MEYILPISATLVKLLENYALAHLLPLCYACPTSPQSSDFERVLDPSAGRWRDRVKSDPTFWILARASGLLAYALLTASVLAGLVLRARPFGTALKRAY